ncbi:MAG TPA: substrate-binding domain-containing protein [Acidobacteriota bacterium]|nr:substrate-binding domain-containing protein [Acidobacteriota bacterium]
MKLGTKYFILLVLLISTLAYTSNWALPEGGTVRLALVNVPDELLRPLLPDFQKQTGLRAEIVYAGSDPFGPGREGKADLVISHYGHEGVEPFVTAGLGLWPHPVFANQMALLGPPSDPAHVRGLTDAAEAFRRIAATKSPFLVNDGAGAKYLEEILWTSAGVQEKGSWYLNLKSEGKKAAQDAAQKGAYVLWGLPPFLRLKRQGPVELVPLVVGDPIFQRMMVSIIVNPAKVAGVNAQGAKSFQEFLIAPSTQARIRAFRYPDFDQQAWWPAGRHNNAQE